MKVLNWGIIGCGDVTEIKSGPAFQKANGSNLLAVMRRTEEKVKDYARRHGVLKWYTSADMLINDPEINAIYIATPPDTHAEYAIRALEAGKTVYVEKPMARTYFECLSMIKASEENEVPLYVAYYRRALPGFIKIKELIDQGEIGNVRFVNMQLYKSPSEQELSDEGGWRVDPDIAGGGHFFDLASHQLDYLDYLFGPINFVNSIVANQAGLYEAEDIVSANFAFESGVIASGTWCFSTSNTSEIDKMIIVGNKGQISFSCFGFVPIVLENENGTQEFPFEKPKHVQQNLVQLVVDDILGKGKSPSNGYTGARTSWVLDEVVKSYYSR